MAISIKQCSIEEWQARAELIDAGKYQRPIFLDQNLFMSCQFMGEEAMEKMSPVAFCIEAGGTGVAWALAYFLSPKVLRLRGLYVDPAHRGRGHMRSLVNHICEEYKGRAERILSFSTPQGIEFHLRSGFTLVENFEPRPIEHYDPISRKAYCDPEVCLTLFERRL